MDLASRIVIVRGREVKMTPTEYSLLRLLVRNAGKVVTHRQILKEVWGPNYGDQTHYLRVYIAHLREKIEASPDGPNCSSPNREWATACCRRRRKRPGARVPHELLSIDSSAMKNDRGANGFNGFPEGEPGRPPCPQNYLLQLHFFL